MESISLSKLKKDYGDFQTNIQFAERVCKFLKELGYNPNIVIEPTCGEGNFIVSSLKIFPEINTLIGIDIQDKYVELTQRKIRSIDYNKKVDINIIRDDIFKHNFKSLSIDKNSELLLIGNPPWVTNSELNGNNLPEKKNYKRENGLDAITGKANFDISEYILFHLMKSFSGFNANMAFLCKTQVVRNILNFLPKTNLKISDLRSYLFDAKKEFDVSVDACLFICKLNGISNYQCKVFNLDRPETELFRFGWVNNKFVSNVDKYIKTHEMDGKSSFIWWSGVKHDCSKVMELEKLNGGYYRNQLNEKILLEEDVIYSYLKSSDLNKLIITNSNRKIIITQKKPNESTTYISSRYPRLWDYLIKHQDYFQKRRSSIYKNSPDFSIFGIGDYSFAPYKITKSGLYKNGYFSLVTPDENNKPIMLDDTCYLLGFQNKKSALIMISVLNSELVRDFLNSIVFIDAKRPYNKQQLMRIDLRKALHKLGYNYIHDYLSQQNILDIEISESDINQLYNPLNIKIHDTGCVVIENYAKP